MKVLSIREPYATLILNGTKTIETRSYKTNYRGPILIHASLGKDKIKSELLKYIDKDNLNYGNIICICNIVDCIYMTKEYIENIKNNDPLNYISGDYQVGRYAWVLDNVHEITKIPAKGQLGLWNYNNLELIDVYDENNNSLNYFLDREKIHELNMWHRHVSVWIMNYNGEILLQQRAFIKKKNPGLFSKTGGHVNAGEEPIDAAKREVFEEIGLKVTNIKEIDLYKSRNPKEHYYTYGYIVFTDLKENEFIVQKEEVEQVKYFKIEEIEEQVYNNNPLFSFTKWDRNDFKRQMDMLKNIRDEKRP